MSGVRATGECETRHPAPTSCSLNESPLLVSITEKNIQIKLIFYNTAEEQSANVRPLTTEGDGVATKDRAEAEKEAKSG